jgi:hypothetical protein
VNVNPLSGGRTMDMSEIRPRGPQHRRFVATQRPLPPLQQDVALQDRVPEKLEEWRVCHGSLPVLGWLGKGVHLRSDVGAAGQLRTVRWHGGSAGDRASEHR